MAQIGTRRRVLDVALACFLADGYEQTTIARIRNRSGTSNGALFHHFPTKEAIADALYVEAIASFQQGLWDLLGSRPRSLREAVRGAIGHQLAWTEQNADLARFVYARGHLDWNSGAGAELAARNRDLAAAFREWMAPLVARGEIRRGPMLLITAVVSGPAHTIAQRWLAGHLDRPLTSFVDELTDAACAGLRAAPSGGAHSGGAHSGEAPTAEAPTGEAQAGEAQAGEAQAGEARAGEARADDAPAVQAPASGVFGSEPAAQQVPARSRVTLELLADDGTVVAHSQTTAPFATPEPPGAGHTRPGAGSVP